MIFLFIAIVIGLSAAVTMPLLLGINGLVFSLVILVMLVLPIGLLLDIDQKKTYKIDARDYDHRYWGGR